jgi:hypothetical protein
MSVRDLAPVITTLRDLRFSERPGKIFNPPSNEVKALHLLQAINEILSGRAKHRDLNLFKSKTESETARAPSRLTQQSNFGQCHLKLNTLNTAKYPFQYITKNM